MYAYVCTQCGHRFEKIQGFNDESEKECPQCHGALERPLTVPALQFKGAGFYVNDYAGKSGASASKSSVDDAPTTSASKIGTEPPPDASTAAAE